ncbi:hypothetical protein CCO44_23995 [Salmonella enterica subsp. enterica serovar Glostrup]|nr:hypothetical protein CCO44_23995 [Salmonella enterica subsp. enterica serovar Glostrup]
MKKPILTDGLFCVCGNCKNVGLISAAPSGNLHRRMAAPPYPAYRDAPIHPQYNHKPSQHRYGKLLPIEYQESSHDPLPKTLEYLRH